MVEALGVFSVSDSGNGFYAGEIVLLWNDKIANNRHYATLIRSADSTDDFLNPINMCRVKPYPVNTLSITERMKVFNSKKER